MSVSTVWIVAIMFAVLALLIVSQQGGVRSEIDWSFFKHQLDAGNVAKVEFNQEQLLGKFKKAPEKPKDSDEAESESTSKAAPELLKDEFKVNIPTPLAQRSCPRRRDGRQRGVGRFAAVGREFHVA